MNSSKYIIGFTALLTAVVALVLSLMYTGLKEKHKQNELLFEKRAMLGAIQDKAGIDVSKMKDIDIIDFFTKNIEQVVVDTKGNILSTEDVEKLGYKGGKAENIDLKKEMKKDFDQRILPVYIYKSKDGNKIYILKLFGKGLWDEISGYLALNSDLNTIIGASFDHKGETPGMGAEMKDNPKFRAQFKGKKIYDESGKLVSINVRKGGAVDPEHDVDAISGATLTSNGITDMLLHSLENYNNYLKKLKQK
ncbi:MAG TPA: NADH:ubiquinone reductase (Na(+)-transporting) subunit C [Bacteroidetes bacterium]|nr:NADH:ubiquinone reductase (Na(+)-transporting) subunit C [Bacteroidota bacterium]